MARRNLGLSLLGAALGGRLVATALRRRFRLDGRVVVVTGGSRGLGLLLARHFAAKGAKVAICARGEQELDRARRQLERSGATVYAQPLDLTDPAALRAFFAETERRLGPIDVLVNNAGIIQVGPASTMSDADFEAAMEINYRAARRCTGAVLPGMLARGSGRIVNVSSIGGVVAAPHLLPYTASKFAITGWSTGLAAELAGTGVRVLTVVPGLMRTGSFGNALFKGRREREVDWFSLGASLPLVSVGGQRAARKIVQAVEDGRRWLALGAPWKLVRLAAAAAPETMLAAEGLIARALPDAGAATREQQAEPGWRHRRGISRSVLTALGDRAARANNELPARPEPRGALAGAPGAEYKARPHLS